MQILVTPCPRDGRGREPPIGSLSRTINKEDHGRQMERESHWEPGATYRERMRTS
jgi:hypothetical protein